MFFIKKKGKKIRNDGTRWQVDLPEATEKKRAYVQPGVNVPTVGFAADARRRRGRRRNETGGRSRSRKAVRGMVGGGQ